MLNPKQGCFRVACRRSHSSAGPNKVQYAHGGADPTHEQYLPSVDVGDGARRGIWGCKFALEDGAALHAELRGWMEGDSLTPSGAPQLTTTQPVSTILPTALRYNRALLPCLGNITRIGAEVQCHLRAQQIGHRPACEGRPGLLGVGDMFMELWF